MYATNILHTATHGPSVDVDHREMDNLTIDTKFDEMVHDELHLDDQHADDTTTPVALRRPQARCADGHGDHRIGLFDVRVRAQGRAGPRA